MRHVELKAHQLLRTMVQVEVNYSCVCVLRGVSDRQCERDLTLTLLTRITNQVQLEFLVVGSLLFQYMVFLSVAIVGGVVAGVRV